MTALSDLAALLTMRGIADIAERAGWKPYERAGVRGWLYPVLSNKLPGHSRWKSAEPGNGAKYAWYPNEAPERPKYYALGGLHQAIAESNGKLYLASGEPDVLVYHAAGAANALCWFGEMSVPASLVADLKALGVTQVIYPHDRDQTGAQAAAKVRAALEGSGIALRVLQLPGENDHYDINKLWIDAQFDRGQFWNRIENLPEERPTPAPATIDWDAAYEDWCKDVERAAVAAWHIDERQKDEWSRTLFSSPTRQDSDPSARWNYATHGFKDFGTGEFCNTHQVADLLSVEAWEARKDRLVKDAGGPTPRQQSLPARAAQVRTVARRTRPEPESVRVVSSDDAMSTVMDWIEGDVPPSEPILSPYAAMHQLQGMARLWERRKLIYVIGAAGMGKTAFAETGADALRRRGQSVIYWGPEWTPEEVQMKAIARYGGPSFEAQRLDHLWQSEEKRGVPEQKRNGVRLTDEQRDVAMRVAARILEWTGKAFYIDRANLSIEDTMRVVKDITDTQRQNGLDMAAFFCDYLQKAKLPGSMGKWDELENKANVISYACIEANLVGVVLSQVGKTDSRQLRKNTQLDAASAQGLSDQLCNLYVTLNPVFDSEGNRLERGVIRVEKNSSGYAPSAVTVKTALYRGYWTNEITTADVELPDAPAPDGAQ